MGASVSSNWNRNRWTLKKRKIQFCRNKIECFELTLTEVQYVKGAFMAEVKQPGCAAAERITNVGF